MIQEPFLKQQWTFRRVICYLLYRLIAKHLSGDIPVFGKWFQIFRRAVCRPLFKESAQMIGVGMDVDFANGCNIVMKDHANIGDHTLLEAGNALITIGRHVMMGKYCIIIAQNHRYLKEGYDGYEGKDVLIDDHAWIGHRVTILPGVRIGKHAVIGAGSVVSKDVPDYGIAVGNPAIVIKFRK